jgi:proteasome lid subunit RPN8/RPN11
VSVVLAAPGRAGILTCPSSRITLKRTLTLHLAPPLRQTLAAWIGEGYPRETCGLLVGRVEGDEVVVESAARARNMNRIRAHDRFELDPRDFIAADEAARRDGREIVGIWHSHPDRPAEPSETDRLAAWEGWSYLIGEVTAAGAGALRSWRLLRDRFVEEALEP